MLVVGPLFQITAFLFQFLALPFPLFALSFAINSIGAVFQVGIVYIYKRVVRNNVFLIRSSLRLRMASLLHFKETLNTKWVACMLHTVHLFINIYY